MCEVEEEGEEREVCSFTYTQVFISHHFHGGHVPGSAQDISIIVLTQGKPHCSSSGSGDDARLEVAAFFLQRNRANIFIILKFISNREMFKHFMFRSEKMAVTTCHHRHNVRARTDVRAQGSEKGNPIRPMANYAHFIDTHIGINLEDASSH